MHDASTRRSERRIVSMRPLKSWRSRCSDVANRSRMCASGSSSSCRRTRSIVNLAFRSIAAAGAGLDEADLAVELAGQQLVGRDLVDLGEAQQPRHRDRALAPLVRAEHRRLELEARARLDVVQRQTFLAADRPQTFADPRSCVRHLRCPLARTRRLPRRSGCHRPSITAQSAARWIDNSTLRESHASHRFQHEPHRCGHPSHWSLSDAAASPRATEDGDRGDGRGRGPQHVRAERAAGAPTRRRSSSAGARPPSGPTSTVQPAARRRVGRRAPRRTPSRSATTRAGRGPRGRESRRPASTTGSRARRLCIAASRATTRRRATAALGLRRRPSARRRARCAPA